MELDWELTAREKFDVVVGKICDVIEMVYLSLCVIAVICIVVHALL